MSGYEADASRSAEGSEGISPETLSSHECHFSGRYSLPGQVNCESTKHSLQKYHSSRQIPIFADT